MRIVGGKLGGLRFPAKIPSGVRPTQDAVREAMFNILNNYCFFDEALVADLCSGTGALGFEALSRGASKCVFVDKSIKSIKYIESAAKGFNLDAGTYSIICGDVIKFIHNCVQKFQLIFSDPPYNSVTIEQIITAVNSSGILSPGGIFVAEHNKAQGLKPPPNWIYLSRRCYGDTIVEFFEYSV